MALPPETSTAPKPPGSRHSISPPGEVLEIEPAKVLQGAVRLHGLASSPTPETQVRVAWALAEPIPRTRVSNRPARPRDATVLIIVITPTIVCLASAPPPRRRRTAATAQI